MRRKARKQKERRRKRKKGNINLLIFIAAVLDPRYKLLDDTNAVIEGIFGHESG
jgi:hypothetical protein